MKNALEIVAAKNAKNQEDKNKAPLTPTTKTNTPATAEKTSNAGVPQSLLERVSFWLTSDYLTTIFQTILFVN